MSKFQLKLSELNPNQALTLHGLLAHPTDTKAIKELGWSRDKFYRYKKDVVHLKEEIIREIVIETQASLAMAARFAICKLIELLEVDSCHFQKEVADDILDRFERLYGPPQSLRKLNPYG